MVTWKKKKREEMRRGDFFCGENERVREGDVGEGAQEKKGRD